MVPALGAEQMVAFCGGIYAVLIALRVDVRAAFLPQGPQSKDSPSQGLVPIAFPWEEYGAVVTALRRKGQDRPDLLGKAGTIPDSALKAMRYAMLNPFLQIRHLWHQSEDKASVSSAIQESQGSIRVFISHSALTYRCVQGPETDTEQSRG